MNNVIHDSDASSGAESYTTVEESRKRKCDSSVDESDSTITTDAANGGGDHPSPYKRALMALKDEAMQHRHDDLAAMAMIAVLKSKHTRADRLIASLKTESDAERKRTLWERFDTVILEMVELEKQMMACANMPRQRPPAVSHFFAEMMPGL
jgi:hypothetical protein